MSLEHLAFSGAAEFFSFSSAIEVPSEPSSTALDLGVYETVSPPDLSPVVSDAQDVVLQNGVPVRGSEESLVDYTGRLIDDGSAMLACANTLQVDLEQTVSHIEAISLSGDRFDALIKLYFQLDADKRALEDVLENIASNHYTSADEAARALAYAESKVAGTAAEIRDTLQRSA